MADTVNSPSPKEDIMGLFDSLKNMFAHHEHHHGASIGQPLTLADAKAVLAFIVVHQQLADMRKVADAVKQLQDEMPQYITFGMSHYYSEPKRVRFQSEGGKFIDADAIATAFAETTVLQDECEIQHLMGDIEDNREHRDPAKTPAVPIDELVRVTDERLATGNDEERSRAWLFALFDPLDARHQSRWLRGDCALQRACQRTCRFAVKGTGKVGEAGEVVRSRCSDTVVRA